MSGLELIARAYVSATACNNAGSQAPNAIAGAALRSRRGCFLRGVVRYGFAHSSSHVA